VQEQADTILDKIEQGTLSRGNLQSCGNVPPEHKIAGISRYGVGKKCLRYLMRLMGLMAVYQKPKTVSQTRSIKGPPYLLRDLTIDRSN